MIHRHTGGLENSLYILSMTGDIHRHTGGLEIYSLPAYCFVKIHRHTGGLEKVVNVLLSC